MTRLVPNSDLTIAWGVILGVLVALMVIVKRGNK